MLQFRIELGSIIPATIQQHVVIGEASPYGHHREASPYGHNRRYGLIPVLIMSAW